MMTCKEYIFKLTSGQLEEASLTERFLATSHRLICPYCRAFTKNDVRLDGILQDYKERVLQPPPDDGAS
ncbi:MAG TPA: hypothetical protein VFM48_11380 [Aquabacterium sp.]|nr:hypothetical protein [Aquabacterium sp.]